MFGSLTRQEKISDSEENSQSESVRDETVSSNQEDGLPTPEITEAPGPFTELSEKSEDFFGDVPSIDVWASDITISFLDLMDIADVNERRKALLKLEMGKKEEDIVTVLKIADSYLFLAQKHYENVAPDDETSLSAINIYSNKALAMKKWLGI